MNGFTAVLDACVLYPAPLRDLLLQLAVSGMFRAKWSEEIQNEWIEALLEKEPHRDRARLERTRELMNAAVLDANVAGHEPLIGSLTLPDPCDRHVLAAAIRCNADAIVTFNERDFPAEVLAAFELEAIHPDTFVCNQLDSDIIIACSAAKACRARLRNPVLGVDEYLATLGKQNLPMTVRRLQGCRDLL